MLSAAGRAAPVVVAAALRRSAVWLVAARALRVERAEWVERSEQLAHVEVGTELARQRRTTPSRSSVATARRVDLARVSAA